MQDSALQAGYKPSVARLAGEKLEPRHQARIKEALHNQGVTTNALASVIKHGLEATKVVTSPTEPDREVVDYGERRQYTKLALEAMGELETKSVVAVQINLPQVAMDRSTWGEE